MSIFDDPHRWLTDLSNGYYTYRWCNIDSIYHPIISEYHQADPPHELIMDPRQYEG